MNDCKIKAGDIVRANSKYSDLQRKFGGTPHRVDFVSTIPSCSQPLIWLDCGGGGCMADGFDIVKGGNDADK